MCPFIKPNNEGADGTTRQLPCCYFLNLISGGTIRTTEWSLS